MKRTLISLLIGAGFAAQAQAVDLMDVYKQALQHDPQFQQANAQRNAAMSGVDISKSALLPQLTGKLGYQFNTYEQYYQIGGGATITGKSHGWNASVSLEQVIYNHGTWVQLDKAEKAAAQAEVNYGAARQGLITRVAQAYFGVLQAKDTLAFREAEKKAIARQLEQTKQRFAVGLTAITDVHEAQAQYDAAVANEISARNAVANSYEALSEITGVRYTDLDVLNTKNFAPSEPAGAVKSWVDRAESNNLSLQAQRMSVDMARDDIKYAKAGHYPTVGLTGQYSTSKTGGDVDQPRLDNSSIGIGISVPIFSGFRTSSQVKQAQSQFVVASEEMERIHRQVVRTIRNAYNNVGASISSVNAFEQSVISSQSALEATEAGFEVGTRTIVDVLNANRQLYQTKQQLAQARYTYILNTLTLKQADGTLGDDDIKAINTVLEPAEDAPKVK